MVLQEACRLIDLQECSDTKVLFLFMDRTSPDLYGGSTFLNALHEECAGDVIRRDGSR